MSWLSKLVKKATKHTSKGFIGAQGDVGKFLDPGGAAISNLQTGKDSRNTRSGLDPGHYFDTLTKKPVVPEAPNIPGTPLIDDATGERAQSDRSRRRRGVLATIFGGAKKSTLG